MRRLKKWLALLMAVCMLCAVATQGFAATDDDVLEGVLANFEELAAIPRPSHHEEKVGAFLLEWAQAQGFDAWQDAVGNVIFDLPATPGCEDAPVVALQAHMDMVAVSTDPDFDSVNTPITIIRTEETLTADGTSLGADDGIGLSILMYYACNGEQHGPMRCIITVNEEDGMTGIQGLDASVVADVRYLINLDAETLGEAIVSTAAGLRTQAEQSPLRTQPTLDTALRIELSGMQGGHSGLMIGAGKINAAQAMGQLLAYLSEQGIAYELDSINSGSSANAIPNQAEALLVVDQADAQRVQELLTQRTAELAAAYSASDPDVTISIEPTELPQTVFDGEQAANIVSFAALVFDGVHTMSQTIDGLVESSSNLGVFRANEDEVTSSLFARSSQEALLNTIGLQQLRLAQMCGYSATQARSSDAWPADPDSELQALMGQVYFDQTGEELKLSYLHAGLECGTFARLNENLDMISIGPEIHDVHSVNETLYLSSVVPVYRLLEETMVRLSQKN
ncbi:MAG TPA: beta-Ala-His dipeptidase [Candidatus Pullichristensenella excrementigallinarum]|uniref:Beta-Ala-His dipeptidase n=1 Tax=Candidatus Pullichristensenella excrementigallinarum TaxID=2840907 RepID=A0A9D1IDB7_9FIRM|nr:beta-Ala-His dipeptidase [Candidatus Pullichristensenella excrementigallinarum]